MPTPPVPPNTIQPPITQIQVNTVLTVADLKDRFLYGIPLQNLQGAKLSDKAIEFHIDSATSWLERYLQIDIKQKQYIQERHDFVQTEYMNWGYMYLNHSPILSIQEIKVEYPDTGQSVTFPLSWAQIDSEGISGRLQLVPGTGSASGFIIGQGGTLLPLIFKTQSYLPDLFQITYLAGFPNNKVPENILSVIGKKAVIDILGQVGDQILLTGIHNTSISIDGLSESVGTQPFVFQQRIALYERQIEAEVSQLRSFYNGLRMTVA